MTKPFAHKVRQEEIHKVKVSPFQSEVVVGVSTARLIEVTLRYVKVQRVFNESKILICRIIINCRL